MGMSFGSLKMNQSGCGPHTPQGPESSQTRARGREWARPLEGCFGLEKLDG